MMEEKMKGGLCGCPHHKMFPLFVVSFGLVFLLEALDILTSAFVAIAWPIIVTAAGLMKLTEGKCKCC